MTDSNLLNPVPDPLPSPVPGPTIDPELSILLVDDDVMVREATAWMLADAGHTVHEAGDGVAALEHLSKTGPVDLLITDINMPRMDGLALVSEVKLRWPGVPVLLVSGRPQPPGTQTFIPKPFGWNMLMHAVSGLMAGKRQVTKSHI